MVHAGCVFVASIHPSRTWTSGSFESLPLRWNTCVHRPDLGLYFHPKQLFGEWSQNPCLLQGKNPLYWKKLYPEEDWTNDTASNRTASPTHYQRAIPAPTLDLMASQNIQGLASLWRRKATYLHCLSSLCRDDGSLPDVKCIQDANLIFMTVNDGSSVRHRMLAFS